MAVKFKARWIKEWQGLYSDTKPSSDVPEGSTYHAVDNGMEYVYHNGAWWPDLRRLAAGAGFPPIASWSESPSASPSESPSESPSVSPSVSPSNSPSVSPSRSPSNSPSVSPSNSPSVSPSASPSVSPSVSPS